VTHQFQMGFMKSFTALHT